MAEVTTTGSGSEKAQKVQKKSWWKNMKAEFGKIIWPEKDTLAKQTVAVVVISIVLGVIIAILDSGILQLVNLLMK